ncbi:MAG: GntR family transcriptional regulator, partial [Promethearchaeota archaeon]
KESDVKESLNVSSSPIREAFNQLTAEGLLTRNPHIGTTVTSLDIEDAKEAYYIQSLLQGIAVRISCRKLNEKDIVEAENLNNVMKQMLSEKIDVKKIRIVNYKFHMILCGKRIYPWLTRLISSLWIRLPTHSIWLMPQRPRKSVQHHDRIIKAVRKKDAVLAGNLMKDHLEDAMKALYGDYQE